MAESENLKFSSKDFQELDSPNLFTNLWIYNYFNKHKPCVTCDTYSDYCEEILRSRWEPLLAHCDFVIDKIKKCDENFFKFSNISNFSNKNRWEIIKQFVKKNVSG